jgi:hypothetical protein
MKIQIEAAPQAAAVLLLVAAVGLGLWAYLTRYPVLAPRRRWILLSARLLALAAVLVSSLAPVVRYAEVSRARNRLLVLVDHSGSMEASRTSMLPERRRQRRGRGRERSGPAV